MLFSLLIIFAERKAELKSLFAFELLQFHQVMFKFIKSLVDGMLMLFYLLIMMLNLVQVFSNCLVLLSYKVKNGVGLENVQTYMSHVCVKMYKAFELWMSLEVDLFFNYINFYWIHACQ